MGEGVGVWMTWPHVGKLEEVCGGMGDLVTHTCRDG